MADALALWLYGTRLALISRTQRGRLRLEYTPDAVARYGLGAPILSLAMPVSDAGYTHVPVRAFLDGLLPEGEPRQIIARELHLDPSDTYGLIEELGRDCAGAVVIQPDYEPAPETPSVLVAEPIDDADLEGLVDRLRQSPLGIDRDVRLSLAGVQEKLLLTRIAGSLWGRPVAGAPSTHILKPSLPQFPDSVANEAFCLRLAGHLGLPVAHAEVATAGERKLLVVERFDRVVLDDGSVERVHQEDFCQALSILPTAKYQEDGGPSWRQIAEVLQAATPPDSLETLLRAVLVNVLIGNADAHGKNLSIVHEASGAMRLAPLYDLVCTLAYRELSPRMSIYIDSVQRLDRVTSSRVLAEAGTWGMSRTRAVGVIQDVLARTPDAIEAARANVLEVPDAIPELVLAQLKLLSAG